MHPILIGGYRANYAILSMSGNLKPRNILPQTLNMETEAICKTGKKKRLHTLLYLPTEP